MGIIMTLWDRWRSWRMFKHIDIKLTGPIYGCEKQDLEWNVPNSCLKLKCMTCGVELFIPNKQFKVRFMFDTPYPAGEKSKEPARVLQLVRHDDREKEEEQQ